MNYSDLRKINFNTDSARQTQQLGYQIGQRITLPACIALSGELGVGKTCLAQGIMRGVGVEEAYLTSPSYTLINQYRSPKGLVFHCDLYRLASLEEMEELGLDECLAEGIVLIEWPEKFISGLNKERFLHIELSCLGETERKIEFTFCEEKYNELFLGLFK